MILLGRWQLDVSNRKGFSLQNSAYSVQWWAFALFAIFFWYRVIRDHAKRPPTTLADQQPEVLPYRPYLPPTAVRSGDEVHGAYNDYLAQLAQSDRRKGMIDE